MYSHISDFGLRAFLCRGSLKNIGTERRHVHFVLHSSHLCVHLLSARNSRSYWKYIYRYTIKCKIIARIGVLNKSKTVKRDALKNKTQTGT